MMIARFFFVLIAYAGFMSSAFAADAMKAAALEFVPSLKSECDQVLELSAKPEFSLYQEKSLERKTSTAWLVVRVPCNVGAYNIESVWLIVDENNSVKRASFSVPQFKTVFESTKENDPTGESDIVKLIRVSGYSVVHSLINSKFDPTTGIMNHFSKGRGLGDVYDSGNWRLKFGEFVLETYETDPVYDLKQVPAMKLDFTK